MKTQRLKKGTGTRLWEKSKKLIPGGSQLLSKRSEMFLPDYWPSYFIRSRGINVWDPDGNRFRDFASMGIGCCLLGYANPQVNRSVKDAIDRGSASTLNSPEEVELTERLIAYHPWAHQARYTRSGGEACSVAVRIARAATGRDRIAFCGYHGWHDWYLAANLGQRDSLKGHLLPGLEPAGVPSGLKGTAIPFQYGDDKALEALFRQPGKKLAAVIMEVKRHQPLNLKFLKRVRALTKKYGVVLIFDEITSGFRMRIGGMHMLHSLVPDVLVLGKALGNGFPIAAVLGKRSVMQAAQTSFISSTHWTERTGFAAALAVLQEFERKRAVDHNTALGEILKTELESQFQKHNLPVKVTGFPSTPILSMEGDQSLEMKTFYTQEMLKRGYLASSVLTMSLAHTPKDIKTFLSHTDEVFANLASHSSRGTLQKTIQGPVCHGGFKRLN